MPRAAIPLFKILGIPIRLDFSWFIIFALITWMLAGNYYPHEYAGWPVSLYWFMGALTAVALFASVLLHELGHSVVALYFKVPVRSITLFLFGGVAEIGKEPPSAKAEFLIAIAGPIVSFMLAGLFLLIQPAMVDLQPLMGLAKYLTYINASLVIFNLIPGFPLDGGRVFRAVIWALTGDMRRATLIAANTGRFFGFLFIMFGVWVVFQGNFGGGIWIAFIGWFLEKAASQQASRVQLEGLLTGHTVAQAMGSPCQSVAADLTLQQLADEFIFKTGKRCFLVGTRTSPVGLITLHRMKEVPRQEWPVQTVAQQMIPLKDLKQTTPESELWLALQQMDRDGVNQLPVIHDGEIVGMLTREDSITFLRTLQEIGT